MAVSSLASGISGLKTSQTALNVIGDNLANLNTSGFKSSRVNFSDELSQILRAAQAPISGGVGGKNPLQIGTGTRVASIDVNYAQGGLDPTGRPFDLAIQGDGFFVVTDGTQDYYTRVGAFNLDLNNDLVDSATGLKVRGTTATINIPVNTVVPANATTIVDLIGNLDSAASTGAVNQVVTTTSPFQVAGPLPATAGTALNSLLANTTNYVTGDVINVSGVETNGTNVSTSFTFGTGAPYDGTTLGDLRNFTSASFGTATATIDASGNIMVTADAPGTSNHVMTLADASGNTGATTFPSFSITTTGSGSTYVTTVPVFDAQGKSYPVTLTFSKASANTWAVAATMKPADGSVASLGITAINFNNDGSFASITGTTDLTITLPAGIGTQVVNFNLGLANAFNGLTQLNATSSAAAVSQDGFGAGFYLSSSVNADGTIDALFTNGQTQTLDQIQLATFANPAGLTKDGRNMVLPSVASGQAVLRLAGTGSAGSITSGSLESSNVDIAEEFTKLIISQRAFQANARTITTADEVLQELVNIVR
jgi:flagellar hook protein FlgE